MENQNKIESPVFEIILSDDGKTATLRRNSEPRFSVTLTPGTPLLDWAKAFRGAGEFLKQIHYKNETGQK